MGREVYAVVKDRLKVFT